jgi:hypothetical protein
VGNPLPVKILIHSLNVDATGYACNTNESDSR